jgi:hypothetical protein
MRGKWSVLALVAGLLGGYAAGSRSAEAQVSGYGVNLGERVNFVNEDGQIMGTCHIAAITGDYIGCSREGARDNEVVSWWRMERVVQIQKLRAR